MTTYAKLSLLIKCLVPQFYQNKATLFEYMLNNSFDRRRSTFYRAISNKNTTEGNQRQIISFLETLFAARIIFDGKCYIINNDYLPQDNTIEVLKNEDDYKTFLTNIAEIKENEKIRVIDTYMPYLLNQDKNNINNWLKRGNIQLIMLNPLSELFKKRIKLINENAHPMTEIKSIINELETLVKNIDYGIGKRIEVRLYDGPLSVNYFSNGNISYFAYFLAQGSTRNTFWQKATHANRICMRDLDEHFITIWEKSQPLVIESDLNKINNGITIEMLNSGIRDIPDNPELANLTYQIYNLDDAHVTPYQSSIIKIENNGYSCLLTYRNRRFNTLEKVKGTVSKLNTKCYSFKFKKDSFFLKLMIYISPIKEGELIGGYYLHTDTNEFPKASVAILRLVTLDEEKIAQLITRDSNDIPNNIKQLLNFHLPNTFKLKEHTTLEALLENLQQTHHIVELEHLAGDWKLYYPEHETDKIYLNGHKNIAAVAQFHFNINFDENEKAFRATLITREGERLVGTPIITNINNNLYLTCNLFKTNVKANPHNIRGFFYQFHAKLNGTDNMFGTYSMSYGNDTNDFGAGIVILKRATDPIVNASSINPISANLANDQALNAIVQKLMFKQKSSIKVNENFQVPTLPFDGIFHVYTYGTLKGDPNTKCIMKGMIRIYKSGYVEYKNYHGDRFISGIAKVISNNLFIQLTNDTYDTENLSAIDEKVEKDREGLFIVKFNPQKPINQNSILCGIFSGMGWTDRALPIAKRIIFDYQGFISSDKFEKFKPSRIELFSPEYEALDSDIAKILTGRFKNYIGFNRFDQIITDRQLLNIYNSSSISLGKIFFNETMQLFNGLENLEADKAIFVETFTLMLRLFRRSVMHGYKDIGEFFDRVEKSKHRSEFVTKSDKNQHYFEMKMIYEKYLKK